MTGSHRLDPAYRLAIRELGLSPANVLRRAGLAAGLFARPSPAVSTEGFFRLWEAIGDEAGDSGVGVALGRMGADEIFSPPLLAALASPDLATAAHRLARFKDLVGPLAIAVLDDGDGGLSITVRGKGLPVPATLAVTELSFWVHLARRATREPVRPTRAALPSRPASAPAIEEALGVRLRTGPDVALAFSAADARRPFLTADAEAWSFFGPVLEGRLAELAAEAALVDRVDAALVELLPAGRSSVEDVAETLALSPRTLQRHLRQEGTSFGRALAATRERLARHYLRATDLATTEVALLLGYDDPNSFYRAFRAWTGTTPQRARAQGAPV